jgi:hypothetical protein
LTALREEEAEGEAEEARTDDMVIGSEVFLVTGM